MTEARHRHESDATRETEKETIKKTPGAGEMLRSQLAGAATGRR